MIGEIPGLCTYLDDKHIKQCQIYSYPLIALSYPSPLPHHRHVVQNVQLVQQNFPHPPPTINTILGYTHYTHAPIIFIVLYPSCIHTHHTPTHLRLSLGIHGVECLQASLTSDTTHSLVFQHFLHAGTQETPPPHLYDMHYGLLAYCPGWCKHSSVGLLSTDSTWITGRTFRETSYCVTFNLCFPFILRFFDLLQGSAIPGRMQPCLSRYTYSVSRLTFYYCSSFP